VNLYTQTVGGIGDILLDLFKQGSRFGYFQALKARGDSTMLVAHANTDAAYDLLKGQPYVDHLRFRGKTMRLDTAPGAVYEPLKRWDGLTWTPRHVILDGEEERLLRHIGCTPYVAVHMSASLPEKVPPHFVSLLDHLHRRGVRTVLLGCESNDNDPAVIGNRVQGFRSSLVDSDFILLPPKLRLHVAVAQCARKFIGTLSCFNCAAQIASVPSYVIADQSIKEPRVYSMMARNRTIVRFWNDHSPILSAAARLSFLDRIYSDAAEWAKR